MRAGQPGRREGRGAGVWRFGGSRAGWGWIRGGAGRRRGTGDAGARITVRGCVTNFVFLEKNDFFLVRITI